MTTIDRDLRIWQIRDIASRVGPDDMTDAELAAAVAIFGVAEARLPGSKPIIMRIVPGPIYRPLDAHGPADQVT
jgi:hypothetical protein